MLRILLPTDMSDDALHAARYALGLGGPSGMRLAVVHTYLNLNAGGALSHELIQAMVDAAHEGLAGFEERLRRTEQVGSAEITRAVEHGDLPNVVERIAREDGIDLVVMGTKGASGLQEVLMGSNTADVLRSSPVPVLAVPAGCALHAPRMAVIADDGGPVRLEHAAVLIDLLRRTKARVVLVRVLRPGAPAPTAPTPWDEVLADIPREHHLIEADEVTPALDTLVRKLEADLLVLLHRHRGVFASLFHRSSSARMAMHSHVPMLVLQQRDAV